MWIAKFGVKLWELALLLAYLAYMDDVFGADPHPELVFYAPYKAFFPRMQVQLLELWDFLGIPHKQPKQIYGRSLTIIGFDVDSAAMTIRLPSQARTELVSAIRTFVDEPSRRHPLRQWQRLLGWINWGLNVHPLLRPALQSSYEKMGSKSWALAPIYLNLNVRHDLLWVADRFAESDGIHVLTARSWGPADAEILIYCDASLDGMGFWAPRLRQGFTAPKPPAPADVEDNIFWYEALTVAAAIVWSTTIVPRPRRVGVYTDNLNSVQMFNSLKGRATYNDILRFVCGLMTSASLDVRVWHIPGTENTVADCLSRGLLEQARQYCAHLRISPFIPPRVSLGERK